MKIFFKPLLPLLLIAIAYYVWHVHFNYRLEVISPNKVYKSALIAPDKIESFLIENKIKTVIDLLHPELNNALNPAGQSNVDEEDKAIKAVNKKHKLSIKHVNIQSDQVPTQENLNQFFKVLDDKANYPILIHCYHGTGRAQMYSALYRIEYEGWSNKDARDKTRVIVEALGYRSSFAEGKPKGDFLINYKIRKEEK
jgi:protein tyrosine phosphatase (PTP) superfamily phosphohydrolase (DUF442 family)